MRLDEITAVDLSTSHSAVVRSLRSWETTLGPAIWPAVMAEKCVLLLETEPDVVLGVGLHQSSGFVAVVELVGGSIWIPGLAHDQDIVTQSDGIWVHGDRSDVDIGVVAWRLAGRGPVEVPFGKVVDATRLLLEGLQRNRQY